MGEREAFSPGGWCQGGEGRQPTSSCLRAWRAAPKLPSRIQSCTVWSWLLLARAGSSDPPTPRRKVVRVLALQVGKLAASPNSLDPLPSALQGSYYPSHQNTCLDPADLSSDRSLLCSPSQQHLEGAIHAPLPSLNPLPHSRSPTTSVLSSPRGTCLQHT